jgi:hypothetical protein
MSNTGVTVSKDLYVNEGVICRHLVVNQDDQTPPTNFNVVVSNAIVCNRLKVNEEPKPTNECNIYDLVIYGNVKCDTLDITYSIQGKQQNADVQCKRLIVMGTIYCNKLSITR